MDVRRGAIGWCGLLLILTAGPVSSQELDFILELTVADMETSTDTDADWGWWSPGKYDLWGESPDDGVDVVDARLVFPGEEYTVFFAAERFPTLRADAVRDGTGGGDVPLDVELELEVFDLVLGRRLGPNPRSRFMPWLGVTYVTVDETRALVESAVDRSPDDATAGLWGVGLGADATVGITDRVVATGRLVARWAEGSRDATFLPDDADPDDPQAGRIEQSDDVEVGMWGAEVGVRWLATRTLHLDAGWRYRDWRYDDGPARFSGPYVRLVAGL